MKFFVLYDEETGEIQGRLKTSSPRIEQLYHNRAEVSMEEFRAMPEKSKRVDIAHLQTTGRKRLVAKD